MNGSEQNSDSRTENVLLTRIGEEAVLRPLENVSMNDVKDYVALERKRSRRALVWTSTLMLCVFLFFTIVFLSLGLYMMRGNRALSDAVAELQSVAAANAQFASSFSNGINSVYLALDNVDDRVDMIEKSKTTIHQEYDALLVDVQRIKGAVGGTDEEMTAKMAALSESLEAAEQGLRRDVDALREEVANVLMSVPVGAVPPGLATASAVDSGERADAPPPDGASPTGRVDALVVGTGSDAQSNTNMPDVIDVTSLQPPPGDREIQVVAYPNGDRYEGEMLNGLMHGWGVYYHQNGDRYEGQFEYDLKHGSGVIAYTSGDRYEGGFASDGRSGKGRHYMKNGDKYVGEFENDAMHGNGVLIQKSGNRYSGGFGNGERHGNGTLEFANGDRYAGTFDNGMRSGRGTYAFSDGGRYVGEFRDGLRHGNGKYTYPGGDIYDGQFNDGKREGEGVFVQANGKRIKGLWKNGELLRRLAN